jgi:hypothetical protein
VVACVGDIVERSVETVSCKQRQAFVTRSKTSRDRGALWRKVKVKVISKWPENCLDRASWPGLGHQEGRGASASRLRRWHTSVYSRILKIEVMVCVRLYLPLVLVSHIQCSRHVYMSRQSSSLRGFAFTKHVNPPDVCRAGCTMQVCHNT